MPTCNSPEDFSFLCPDHYFVSQNSLNSQESKIMVCLHQDYQCYFFFFWSLDLIMSQRVCMYTFKPDVDRTSK